MILSPAPGAPVRDEVASSPSVESDSPPPRAIDALPAVMRNARFEELARRVVCKEPREYIAKEMGLTFGVVQKALTDPEFIDVYVRVKNEFYGELDKHIRDERLEPILRAKAQAIRAQTVMGEILTEVQTRIADGRARATDLKVGAELCTAIIDRSTLADEMRPPVEKQAPVQRAAPVSVNFNMGNSKHIRDVVKESGLDLSDILDVDSLDAQTS